MEGGREESWLEGRERSLEGWLDQSEGVVFETELCVGPGGEGGREGDGWGCSHELCCPREGLGLACSTH